MPSGVYKHARRKPARQGRGVLALSGDGGHGSAGVPRHLYLPAKQLKRAVLARVKAGENFGDVELFALLLCRHLTGEDG